MSEHLPPFSVLLPVYIGDVPAHFVRALRSVAADQQLPPDEVVVVCDGPVHPQIARVLDEAEQGTRGDLTGHSVVTVLRLPTNQGLSAALNIGLRRCAHDVVARADADDIALPERFAEQLPLVAGGADLVGSAIAEFDNDEDEVGLVRRMPLTSEQIRQVITYRSPFNHPTVVYRRSVVTDAGGYEHVAHMEDYWLFARMVAAGVECLNHPDPLVLYRVGAGAYARRGGWTMLRSEVQLQRLMRRARITSFGQYVRNLFVRGIYRLVPTSCRQGLYRGVGARRWFSSRSSR